MAEERKLVGIDQPMRFDTSGYPAPAVNDNALKACLRNILLTTPGERVMRPYFGSWLRLLTFDNLNTITALRARAEVRRAITEWEPRVTILGVAFEIDQERRSISVVISWEANGKEGTSYVGVPTE